MAPEMHAPAPGRPVEAVLSVNIVKRAVWVAPLLVGVFWVLRGPAGAAAAAVGVAIVVVNFLLGGWILSTAARVSLSLYHAAALFGFLVRVGLIAAMMFAVAAVFPEVDRPAMGISAIASYLVLLSLETVAVAKGREKELEWTS